MGRKNCLRQALLNRQMEPMWSNVALERNFKIGRGLNGKFLVNWNMRAKLKAQWCQE